MWQTTNNFLATALGAPWLGHGRYLEATLTSICLIYGLLAVGVPGASLDSQATRDIFWAGYGQLVGVPFLLKASLTGSGLCLNIIGWSGSRYLRLCGALVGSFIWAWLIIKFVVSGNPFTFGSVCAFVFLISSIRIIGMALANSPRPGSPGVM